jgi:predicted 3-demethylubiquinone-9 3-methyltransferase (glyoxalase superfamily)
VSIASAWRTLEQPALTRCRPVFARTPTMQAMMKMTKIDIAALRQAHQAQ